jgi:hypothetical protein
MSQNWPPSYGRRGGGFSLKNRCKVLPLRYFRTFFRVFALEPKRKAKLLLLLQDRKIDVCTFLNSFLRVVVLSFGCRTPLFFFPYTIDTFIHNSPRFELGTSLQHASELTTEPRSTLVSIFEWLAWCELSDIKTGNMITICHQNIVLEQIFAMNLTFNFFG